MEEMVIVQDPNAQAAYATITGAGRVEVGENGKAIVTLAQADVLLKAGFKADDETRARVEAYRQSKTAEETRGYDAGPRVRIRYVAHAGFATMCPDGERVAFNEDGYGVCGRKTFDALQAALGDAVELVGEIEESPDEAAGEGGAEGKEESPAEEAEKRTEAASPRRRGRPPKVLTPDEVT